MVDTVETDNQSLVVIEDTNFVTNPELMIPALVADLEVLQDNERELNELLGVTRAHVDTMREASKKGSQRGAMAYIHMQTGHMVTMINSKVSARKGIIETRKAIIANVLKLSPKDQGGETLPDSLVDLLMDNFQGNEESSNPANVIEEGEYTVVEDDYDDLLEQRMAQIEADDNRDEKDKTLMNLNKTSAIDVEDLIEQVIVHGNDLEPEEEDLPPEPPVHTKLEPEDEEDEEEIDEDEVALVAGSDGQWYIIDDDMKVLNDEFEVDTDSPPRIVTGKFGIVTAYDANDNPYPVLDLADLVF